MRRSSGLRLRDRHRCRIFGGLIGIFGGFDGAEGSVDLDVIALLGDARAFGDAVADDADGDHSDDTDADDDGDDDEDHFEGAAAALVGWSGRCAGGGHRGGDGQPHLLQNFVPASRVAPHLLQKAMTYLVRVKSRRREYIAELMGK